MTDFYHVLPSCERPGWYAVHVNGRPVFHAEDQSAANCVMLALHDGQTLAEALAVGQGRLALIDDGCL